jgi:putative chitinase
MIRLVNPNLRMQDAVALVDPINGALREAQASVRLRAAHFLANMAQESDGFTKLEENLNYSGRRLWQVFKSRAGRNLAECIALASRGPVAIANRVYAHVNGNGNEASGDGWMFRGGGPTMLTGRGNHRVIGKSIGVDLEAHPELARTLKTGWQIAGVFWRNATRAGITANQWADRNNIVMTCQCINGGQNGIDDRRVYLARALRALPIGWVL